MQSLGSPYGDVNANGYKYLRGAQLAASGVSVPWFQRLVTAVDPATLGSGRAPGCGADRASGLGSKHRLQAPGLSQGLRACGITAGGPGVDVLADASRRGATAVRRR